MKRTAILATVLVLAAHSLPAFPQSNAPAAPSVTGTFDRPSIVLAFYRSPQWAAILAERQYEMKAAKAANDTARVKVMDSWGTESQELAMRQLAGKAPIDNIVAILQPEFRELTAKMKLAAIVESPGPDPKSATVDVTSLLMDWLRATSETRKMAAGLHSPQSSGT